MQYSSIPDNPALAIPHPATVITDMAIEKGANCLINIAIDLIPAGFEFRADTLTLSDQFMYLFYADIHTLPVKIQDERDLIPWDLRHGMAFYQDAFVSHISYSSRV